MQLVQPQTSTADFNADLIQAQREALKALSEIMAETADPADDDNARLDDDELQTRAARFRRLSLRLRAATAILRVKPLADALPDAPADAQPGARANTNPCVSSTRATENTRDTSATSQTAAPNPQSPRAATQHPRLADSTPQRSSDLASAAAPASRPPFAGDRS